MRRYLTKEEIKQIENVWETHGLDKDKGWEYALSSKENWKSVISGILYPYFASSGMILGDAISRVNELSMKYNELSKVAVEVWIEDDEVAVRSGSGEWNIGNIDNRWLMVLNALAFPNEHKVKIIDKRKNRQEHQKDMTKDY